LQKFSDETDQYFSGQQTSKIHADQFPLFIGLQQNQWQGCFYPEFDSKPLKVGTLLGAVDN